MRYRMLLLSVTLVQVAQRLRRKWMLIMVGLRGALRVGRRLPLGRGRLAQKLVELGEGGGLRWLERSDGRGLIALRRKEARFDLLYLLVSLTLHIKLVERAGKGARLRS